MKNKAILKRKCMEIFLHSQYFSPGAGSNVHKTYINFLKLTKKYFIDKDFILSVVYLLVPLTCNFAKETICQHIVSVVQLTFIEWRSALIKKEGKRL